jgi:hypothetical protein
MPTREKGNGPWSLKQRQSPSALTSEGMVSIRQTSETSSDVFVREKNESVRIHFGKGVPGWKRQIANVSGNRESVRG